MDRFVDVQFAIRPTTPLALFCLNGEASCYIRYILFQTFHTVVGGVGARGGGKRGRGGGWLLMVVGCVSVI